MKGTKVWNHRGIVERANTGVHPYNLIADITQLVGSQNDKRQRGVEDLGLAVRALREGEACFTLTNIPATDYRLPTTGYRLLRRTYISGPLTMLAR